ncbi:hypothetical protein JIG36_34925 [Actinoplanes sp. LDG1-06]|uniref:Uncharacterized protein n=1 Tax=Paractinoplanes ovalisporus TaxID=2810368 RepID=A0ABS2ANA3_9ACTN|nr:alpha/beta hydrolase [Actinoplanes ovalisporus]MBM2620706.1 hypothetical protein [Actinoplanes ovalisporus]
MLATFGPQLASREGDPTGLPPEVFAALRDSIVRDRFQYLENYFLQHYVAEQNLGTRVSAATLRANFHSAATADGYAVLHCVDAWQESFHDDLPKIDVPLLVLHGTKDRNIPEFVPGAEVVEIAGGPHGIGVTRTAEVNAHLLPFVAK